MPKQCKHETYPGRWEIVRKKNRQQHDIRTVYKCSKCGREFKIDNTAADKDE